MTSYSQDTLRDLMDGTLPWPQTRRIMSAYKDEDRFFKTIAVLQDRVAWADRILLPISAHLFIADTPHGRVTKCACGHDYGDYRRNWKLNAAILVRDTDDLLREIYPTSDLPDPAWMELREFICPTCGVIHEVEACAPGYPVLHEFEPDLEGFYADWLGQPLPASHGA